VCPDTGDLHSQGVFGGKMNKTINQTSTAIPERAIAAIVEGEWVVFEYNAHYQTHVSFHPDGNVFIDDEGDVYEYNPSQESALAHYVSGMLGVAEKCKKAIVTIPAGNLEGFGGLDGVARTLFTAWQIQAYLD
jgi:hypothetical protein